MVLSRQSACPATVSVEGFDPMLSFHAGCSSVIWILSYECTKRNKIIDQSRTVTIYTLADSDLSASQLQTTAVYDPNSSQVTHLTAVAPKQKTYSVGDSALLQYTAEND